MCAYLGFRMIFEGPDDPRWWIALSEHAVLCLKAVYFEVLDRPRLYWVPSSVRRAWRVMELEGILEGVEEGVADKVIRLVGYIEHIKWGCVSSEYYQPPDVPGTFTPVFDNGDFVMFDVAEWVPLLGEDGMVETEPQDDESRVASRIDRGARVYGNSRKFPRWAYPDGFPSHDLNKPRAGRYGLSKNQKRTAERALRKTIVGAGLHGTFRRLGLAQYPTFENFIDVMRSMAYKLRPNDEFFVQNPEKVKDHWRAVTPAPMAAAGGINPPFFQTSDGGAGPSGVTTEGAAAATGADVGMAGGPSADVSQA